VKIRDGEKRGRCDSWTRATEAARTIDRHSARSAPSSGIVQRRFTTSCSRRPGVHLKQRHPGPGFPMTIRQLAVAISVPACLVQVSCEMEQKLRPPSASERLRFLNAMKRGVADACTKRASGRNPRRTPADSRTAGAVGESSSSGPSMFSRNRRFRSLPPAACYVAVVAFGSDLIGSAQLRHKFD